MSLAGDVRRASGGGRRASAPGVGGGALPAGLLGGVLVVFAVLAWPGPGQAWRPDPYPDAAEYAHGAAALLVGSYMVSYDDPERGRVGPVMPRYSPGLSVALVPAVAIGGIGWAVLVPYAAAHLAGVVAAALVWRLAGPWWAPLGAAAVLFTREVASSARLVMTEAPSVLLALALLWLLLRSGWRSALLAGVVGGWLLWLRPAHAVIVLAGAAALQLDARRWRLYSYALGAAPWALGLAAWQWWAYGSPLVTGYQVGPWGIEGAAGFEALFGLRYVGGGTVGGSSSPNWLTYATALGGAGVAVTWPGLGVLGLVAIAVQVRCAGPVGTAARFSLAVLLGSLAVYLPYFWQATRFLVVPGALVSLCAVVGLASWAKRRPGSMRARPWVLRRSWGR